MMSGKTNAVRKKAQPQDNIEHLLRGHGQEQGSENWTFSWSTKMGLFPGNQEKMLCCMHALGNTGGPAFHFMKNWT